MTQQGVIDAFIKAGWRWESLGSGLEPVLTNAPEGQRQCPRCWSWQTERNFKNGPFAACQSCTGVPFLERKKQQARRSMVCPRGHIKAGMNLHIYVDRQGKKNLFCRKCRRIHQGYPPEPKKRSWRTNAKGERVAYIPEGINHEL